MPLRVLTLNLWHDSGPWERRRALVRETIAGLGPDLIGFQEVLHGPGTDLAAEVVDGLGYELAFGRATRFWREGDRHLYFGNAVASRLPIREREELALPDGGDGGDGETRAALSVTVDAPEPVGPVAFTCTHLNWRLHHGAIRERQVVALAEHVRARRPRGGFPPIVVGDFNADADAAEIRYMSGLQSLGGRSVWFADAWRLAGDGGPGHTWSNANDYARRELEPARRLDYVFVGPPLRPSGLGQVLACRLVGTEPRDGVWPSDHFGVVAELRTEPLAG